jgi:hypothetical protein
VGHWDAPFRHQPAAPAVRRGQGAEVVVRAYASGIFSYLQTFTRDVCRYDPVVMVVVASGRASEMHSSHRRGAPASSPEGSQCYKGEDKVASRQTQLPLEPHGMLTLPRASPPLGAPRTCPETTRETLSCKFGQPAYFFWW